jgi:hypothetical protein
MNKTILVTFRLLLIALTFFGSNSISRSEADECEWWSRGILAQPSGGPAADNRFLLFQVTGRRCHLTGKLSYYQTENQNPAVRVIEGTRTKDGIFWPYVTSEVKDEKTGIWSVLAAPSWSGTLETVKIKPGESYLEMQVVLDQFKAFIGKQQFGRVILKTGEAATFELKYLSPSNEQD